VTVVEWGEGLVEDLASGHLLVTITRSGPEPLPEPEAPPDGQDGAGDEVRQVVVTGFGARWAAAADELRGLQAAPD
jgi:hypothetical protein